MYWYPRWTVESDPLKLLVRFDCHMVFFSNESSPEIDSITSYAAIGCAKEPIWLL